jgi:hypothetical protein
MCRKINALLTRGLKIPLFSKPTSPVGQTSMLYGFQQPKLVHERTPNFLPKLKLAWSVVYEKNVQCIFYQLCYKVQEATYEIGIYSYFNERKQEVHREFW